MNINKYNWVINYNKLKIIYNSIIHYDNNKLKINKYNWIIFYNNNKFKINKYNWCNCYNNKLKINTYNWIND